MASIKELARKKKAERAKEASNTASYRRIQEEKEASADYSAIKKAKMANRHKKEYAEILSGQPKLDPTEGMSGFEKFAAGTGRGLTDIAQNIGNVLGIVEDDTILDRRALDQPLMNTGAGMAGNILGETAALAPLGFVGKGAQVLHKGLKAGKAMTALPTILTGATEGALAGTLMGGPEERGSGALMGGLAGGVLSGAGQAIGRTLKDGLVKTTRSADDLLDMMNKSLRKRDPSATSFIPIGKAAESGGGALSTNIKALAADVVGFLPSAKGQFQKQTAGLSDDLYETFLRKAFTGRGGKGANEIIKVFRETGDVLKALDKAKSLGHQLNTPAQKALVKAASNKGIGKGRFLRGEAEKGLDVSLIRGAVNDVEQETGRKIAGGTMKELVDLAGENIQRTGHGSSPATREIFYGASDKFSDALGGTADAGLGLGLIGHMLSSKPVQNFLMGNTYWQKALQNALKDKTGKAVMEVMGAIRREMSATGSEPNIQMRDQANSLRQQVGEF